MFKRLIVIITLLLPLTASAQETPGLGPSTNDTPSSTTDASQLLQPASPTTLQSLQSADSGQGGISQPATSNGLQAAGTQADFNNFSDFLSPGSSSPRSTLPAAPVEYPWVWAIAIIVLAVIVFALPSQNSKTRNQK